MSRLVLIAGGDLTQLQALGRGLRREGVEALATEDGRSALLELIRHGTANSDAPESSRIQAVLLDAALVGMGCAETIRSIRESSTREVRKDLPVFVFSADTGPGNRKHFAEMGATGMLAKPLTTRSVIAAIRGSLEAVISEGSDDGCNFSPNDAAVAGTHEGAMGGASGDLPVQQAVACFLAAMRLRTDGELSREFDITPEESRLLAERMMEEIPAAVQTMVDAARTSEPQKTARAAHFLAGSLLSILCIGPAEAARSIEQAIVTNPSPPTDTDLIQSTSSLAEAINDILDDMAARPG